MPTVIRPARPEEYAAVGDLTARAYLDDGFTRPESPYLPVLRDAAARAAHGLLLVAVDDATDQVLGTASLFTYEAGPEWAEHARPGDAVLRMLAVDSAARGRGVGEALTRAAVDAARARGCDRLVLSTQQDMVAAHRIYERLGFRRVRERDWEPLPGVTLIGYELPL